MIKFSGKIVQFGFGAVGKSFYEKVKKEIEFNFEEAENIDKAVQLDKKYSQEFKQAKTLTEKCEVYKQFLMN